MAGNTDRRTVLRGIAAAGTVAIVTPLAGCSSGDGSRTTATTTGGGSTSHTVDMNDNLKFVPESVTVSVGDEVVWENVGSLGHSVTAYEEVIPESAEYFASGDLNSEQAARDGYPSEGDVAGGESYSHTFEVAGTYEYFCIPHETAGMVGTVEVTE